MLCLRFDVSFATISLSRFASNPSLNMWTALVMVYQYLKGTSSIRLTYTKMTDARNPTMTAYTDSDWATADTEYCRSCIGYIVFLSGAAISWLTSFRQPGLSTCEVEYYGLGAAALEVVSHHHLLNELAPLQWNSNSEVSYSEDNEPTTIHTDNIAARQVAQNPVFHKRMKHTHIRHHVIRAFVKNKIVRFQHVYSADNHGDMMVKALAKAALRRHRHAGFGPCKSPNIVFTAEGATGS
jgi:hypothetical protein